MKQYWPVITMLLFIFGGCAQKVQVHALQPAEIDRAAQTKHIAVSPFRNDTVGLSGKIESAVFGKKLNGVRYFTTIGRKNVETILDEQRLQYSGLFDESTAVTVGELLGAQALISGDVVTAASSDSHYYVTRSKCADKKCQTMYEYSVGCTRRLISLSADIRMIDIEKGDIIYADTLSYSRTWSHCADRQNLLPGKEQGLNILADAMSRDFTQKLAPYYVSYLVELLDDPEMDYTDEQEEMLEYAIISIRHGRYQKAEALLSRLFASTQERCFVAAYDLGVVKEIQGELAAAQQLYLLADALSYEPNDAIDIAVVRIAHSIDATMQAAVQIRQ